MFAKHVERVLAHEGGYIFHSQDPGGATNFGITQRVAREHGYKGNMRALPRATAIAIYRKSYWNAVKGDLLPAGIAFQVFDAAVNHGAGNAIRWMQRAANVADDGQFGAVTLGAVLGTPVTDMVLRFNAERLTFYTNLTTFSTFGRGWVRRIAANLRYAAEDN